jgi:hypothetical protein
VLVSLPVECWWPVTMSFAKEIVDDWEFHRSQRQEWSFPAAAAREVDEVTRGFQGFLYSGEAIDHVKWAWAYRAERIMQEDIPAGTHAHIQQGVEAFRCIYQQHLL